MLSRLATSSGEPTGGRLLWRKRSQAPSQLQRRFEAYGLGVA